MQHLIFFRHIYSNNNDKQNRSIIYVHLLIANSLYCNMAHILRRLLLSHLPFFRGETPSNEKTETMMGK